jgi:hypothetical protein
MYLSVLRTAHACDASGNSIGKCLSKFCLLGEEEGFLDAMEERLKGKNCFSKV